MIPNFIALESTIETLVFSTISRIRNTKCYKIIRDDKN